MVTNSAVTVYSRQYDSEKRLDIWKRTYVKDAWWHEAESSAITSEGLKRADTFVIRIPDTTVSIKKDDYLVKGISDIDITTAKDLKGTEYCKVTSANYNTYGANPHIKVGGV